MKKSWESVVSQRVEDVKEEISKRIRKEKEYQERIAQSTNRLKDFFEKAPALFFNDVKNAVLEGKCTPHPEQAKWTCEMVTDPFTLQSMFIDKNKIYTAGFFTWSDPKMIKTETQCNSSGECYSYKVFSATSLRNYQTNINVFEE